MNDSFVKGIWAGLVGTFLDELVHIIAYFTIHTTTTTQYIASLVFHMKNIQGILPILSAFIVHSGAGAMVGIVLVLIFKYFGPDYAYIKGMGLGVGMWIVHIAVIPNIISIPMQYVVRTPLESMVDLIAHLCFGVLTTFVLLKNRPLKKV